MKATTLHEIQGSGAPSLHRVIITATRLAGSGKDHDPYRRVVEVYSVDGELLADNDPLASITPDDLSLFALNYMAKTENLCMNDIYKMVSEFIQNKDALKAALRP